MTLAFTAKFVSCDDVMDGEILQVCFDTVRNNDDEDQRDTPYVLISQNFEFRGPATTEWHDGTDYDGGAEIVYIALSRDRVLIKLDRDLDMDVTFSIGERQFSDLSLYLRRMLDERIISAA